MARIHRRESELEKRSDAAFTRNALWGLAGLVVMLAAGASVIFWGLKNYERIRTFTTFLIRPFIPAEGFFRLSQPVVGKAFYTLLGMLMPLAVPVLLSFLCLWLIITCGVEDTTEMDLALAGRRNALKALENMPDDVHVFTDLRLGCDGREVPADLVTVSPGGITVIQVKPWPLMDEGGPGALERIGAYAGRLTGYLRSCGVECPVDTAVFHMGGGTGPELLALKGSMPVFRHDEEERFRRL